MKRRDSGNLFNSQTLAVVERKYQMLSLVGSNETPATEDDNNALKFWHHEIAQYIIGWPRFPC